LVYIVTYDLKSPNDTAEDYERVIDGLKSRYGNWCHVEKSVWIVSTTESASEVRDNIKALLNASDVLFVARLSGNWASFNLSSKRTDWLKSKEF
jgi:CRISPR/Cas system-associated endoribonuclease Cas2